MNLSTARARRIEQYRRELAQQRANTRERTLRAVEESRHAIQFAELGLQRLKKLLQP